MSKKQKPIYNSITYDSHEEVYFAKWLDEAVKFGIIKDYEYQPNSFLLSEKKTNAFNKHLLHKHIYTADFKFRTVSNYVNKEFYGLIGSEIKKVSNNEFIIDIKGGFNRHGGDRGFSINQKWVAKEYNLFVNKVVPEKFFKKSWIPENIRKYNLRTGEPLKKWLGCKTYKEKNL